MTSIQLTRAYFLDKVQTMDGNLSSIKEKWGSTLATGFVVVPAILLKRQVDLELNAQEVVILLHLIAAWWRANDWPYPRTATIAHRAGMSVRTVQRHLRDLENKGFIRRLLNQPANGRDDLTVTRYDLQGLVEKMRTLPDAPTAAEVLVGRTLDAGPEQAAPNLVFLKV